MRIRSGYSFHNAVGSLKDVFSRVQEIGWPVAPLTDRLSTFGFNRWTKLCKEAEVKPVYGVEIPCVLRLCEKKPIVDLWTFVAIDSLRPLHDLIWLATDNPGHPSLTYAQALAAEGVYVIAGERLLVDSLPDVHERFYGSLGPSTPKGLLRRMLDAGLPLVATSDNVYPRPEDKELYRVGLGKRASTQTYPQHILADLELRNFLMEDAEVPFATIDAAFDNRNRLFETCHDVTMKHAKLLVPERPASLRAMCVAGAKRKGINLEDPVYAERLDRELSVIQEKSFEDYFYILADIIQFAKSQMVVGPARGSSCGSLVCFLLDITSIDPLQYGLIFERFIDVNRPDLPDIDVDFPDNRRDLVFRYVEEKFGKERVARLGTVGAFKAKEALNTAGIGLRIPKWRLDKIHDSIIVRQPGDARANQCLEDTFTETDAGRALVKEHPEIVIATKLEGHPRLSSQHAAGMLLTDEPMREFVAVGARSRTAWCDMKDAEDLNLLKVDMLGLTQMGNFGRTLELIEKPPSFLNDIPLDDPAAFDILNQRKYNGVFQFNGQTLRGLSSKIKFEKLDDLIAISAIARPGAMDSGGADEWIRRRMGEPVPSKHPILDACTSETYGVLVYQETVMRICRELAGFSWPDTSAVRRLIGKRQGAEALNVWREKFVAGCAQNDMAAFEANALWDQIVTFGRYAFNKSHAVAYGIVSYWCCWFKAHYPLAFAAATLDAEGDANKQIAILRELAQEGVTYIPVDIEASTDRWTIDGNSLLGPLTAIKGIGPSKVQEILNARNGGEELKPGVARALAAAKTEIDSIYPVSDRIKSLFPDYPDLSSANIFSDPVRVQDIQPGIRGEFLVLARINRITPKDENSPEMVAKRNGRVFGGNSKSIGLFVGDDTDEIFAKIDRFMYAEYVDSAQTTTVAEKFFKHAKAGKSLYAIKGRCPPDFRMIKILAIRYLGDMDDEAVNP